jgi:hypothetical protein
MRWTVHGETPLYTDEWLDIRLADVELPDGRHLEHRLIRIPAGAGCVTVESDHISWVPLADVPELISRGEISSGTTIAVLLHALSRPVRAGE